MYIWRNVLKPLIIIMNHIPQKKVLENLLKSNFEFKDENGQAIKLTAKGNLAMLAVGYKGLVATRSKRRKSK